MDIQSEQDVERLTALLTEALAIADAIDRPLVAIHVVDALAALAPPVGDPADQAPWQTILPPQDFRKASHPA